MKTTLTKLGCDGDFRSDEVTKLRDEADIIVTNPPFSLFREFLAWIGDKKFLVLGNKNAITYKEVFPRIKHDEMWVGATSFSQDILFGAPANMDWEGLPASATKIVGGKKFLRSPSVWFTNLDHGRRHEPLSLMVEADVVKYGSKAPFQKYDNYDAIEVPKTKWIPSDYKGVMGVPISFLDKYCPEQFELLGSDNPRGCRIGGRKIYKRIFIRHRRPPKP